jgi:hypothetical protein
LKEKTNGKGWILLTDPLIFDESKDNYFVRLPSMQTSEDGEYTHVAKVNAKVSFFLKSI